MEGSGPQWRRSVRSLPLYDRGWQLITAIFVIAYSLSTVLVHRIDGYSTFWDLWIEDIAFFLPAIPMFLAGRRWPAVRAAWYICALGVVFNTAANLVFTLHDQNINPFPTPAPSDYLYLSSYALLIVAVALLTQGRLGHVHASVRLDGAIMALALASLAGMLWFEPILQVSGRPAQVIVTLAYPLCDLVVLILLIAGLAPNRFRPDLSTTFLMIGALWFVGGDVIYLNQTANGTYTTGTFLDATWVIGYWLMGIASSVPSRRAITLSEPNRVHDVKSSPGLLVVPAISGFISLGVIIAAFVRHDRSSVVLALAVAALCLVIARMWLTLREEDSLVSSSKIDARTDALTGLANRRSFIEQVEAILEDGTGAAGVILIDIDGFKDVNDALGHLAGDELLIELGNRFSARVKGKATLARLGGDEFAIACRGQSDAELSQMANDLMTALDDSYTIDGVSVRVGASIGVSTATRHDLSAIELLRRADVAMYKAKLTQTNVSVYHSSDDPNSREHLTLLDDLRTAIDQGAMTLHFQPTLDLATNYVRGVEALARWDHGELGTLYPDLFIPMAERAGLMPRLTRAILQQAVAQAVSLDNAGHELQMSVNISRHDLVDDELPEFLERLLAREGFPAHRLTLEITESTIGSDPERAAASVARLRKAGVAISIDDFGVGYSSMSQLLNLTIDELKIDKSFIIGLQSDERAQAIVRTSVELASALNISLVAEGIEESEVLNFIRKAGVRIAQGYFIARPLPVAQLDEFLTSSPWSRSSEGQQLATSTRR